MARVHEHQLRRTRWHRLGAADPQRPARSTTRASIVQFAVCDEGSVTLHAVPLTETEVGGFQVITAVPVLGEHFRIGQEIVPFRTTEELKELIRHYLDRPEEAAAIARRGQARAHAEHTYEHRLREIMRVSLS